MSEQITISMCEFQDGTYEFYIKNAAGEEVALTGSRRFTDKERDFFLAVAPPCVWTTYKQVNP